MSLFQAIGETQACSDNFGRAFDVLIDHLPKQWIKTSLSLSSHATIRRRRLPEDMVLWLVIGMAMFLYGKKMQRVGSLAFGVVMMIFPMLVHSVVWMWAIAGACMAGLYFTSREW